MKRVKAFVGTLLALFACQSVLAAEIHEAALNGRVEDLKRLVSENPDTAKEAAEGDLRPIHCAAYGGSKEALAFLLENGANINALTNVGATPLHLAVIGGEKDMVQYLVEAGADVRLKNEQGRTPLEELILRQEETLRMFAEPLLKAEQQAGVKAEEREETLRLLGQLRNQVDELFDKYSPEEERSAEGVSLIAPEELKENWVNRTDVEREEYLETIKGKYVAWTGEVKNVKRIGGFEAMQYELPEGTYLASVEVLDVPFEFVLTAYVAVSRQKAADLKKGDRIKVSGSIKGYSPLEFMGVGVILE